MMIEAILFDLDNTLYPPAAGLQDEGDRRINACLARMLGMDEQRADELRRRLWREYGTTGRGLEVEFGIPQRQLYTEAIDCLDPAEFVRPDPDLARMLSDLPHRHYILTNSTRLYAEKVLDVLGVRDHIDGIFDIEWMGWVGKPSPDVYARALRELGLKPGQVLLVEDAPHNLPPARELGMVTVLVGAEGEADYVISAISELEGVLARLDEEPEDRACPDR